MPPFNQPLPPPLPQDSSFQPLHTAPTMPITTLNDPDPKNTPPMRRACDNCRARKYKCSGEPTGCARCISDGDVCVYSFVGKIGRPRKAAGNGEGRDKSSGAKNGQVGARIKKTATAGPSRKRQRSMREEPDEDGEEREDTGVMTQGPVGDGYDAGGDSGMGTGLGSLGNSLGPGIGMCLSRPQLGMPYPNQSHQVQPQNQNSNTSHQPDLQATTSTSPPQNNHQCNLLLHPETGLLDIDMLLENPEVLDSHLQMVNAGFECQLYNEAMRALGGNGQSNLGSTPTHDHQGHNEHTNHQQFTAVPQNPSASLRLFPSEPYPTSTPLAEFSHILDITSYSNISAPMRAPSTTTAAPENADFNAYFGWDNLDLGCGGPPNPSLASVNNLAEQAMTSLLQEEEMSHIQHLNRNPNEGQEPHHVRTQTQEQAQEHLQRGIDARMGVDYGQTFNFVGDKPLLTDVDIGTIATTTMTGSENRGGNGDTGVSRLGNRVWGDDIGGMDVPVEGVSSTNQVMGQGQHQHGGQQPQCLGLCTLFTDGEMLVGIEVDEFSSVQQRLQCQCNHGKQNQQVLEPQSKASHPPWSTHNGTEADDWSNIVDYNENMASNTNTNPVDTASPSGGSSTTGTGTGTSASGTSGSKTTTSHNGARMQSSFPRQQEQGRGQEPPQAQQQHQQLEKSSNSTHITTHKPIHPTFAFPQTLSNSEDAMACTCPMDFFLCYMTLHRSMYEPVPTLHDPNHVHPAHPDAHQAALNLLEKDLEKFFQSTLECGKVLVDKAGVLLNCPRCRGPAHIHSSDNASPSPGGLFPNIPGAPVDPFVGMSAMAMLGNPSSTSTGKGTTAPPPGPWGIGGGPNTLLIGALLPLTIQLYEKVLRAIISPPPPPFSFENIPQCPSSSSSPLPLWRVPAIKALLAEMDKIEMLAREMIRCTRERHVAAHEAGYPRVSFGRGGGPRCKVKANKGASINGKGNATAAAAVEESVSGSGASTGQEYRNPGSASASVMDLDSDSDHNPDSNSKDPASNEEEKEEEEEEEEEDPICLRVVKGMADQIFWRAGYVNELMRGVEGLGIKCGSREEG